MRRGGEPFSFALMARFYVSPNSQISLKSQNKPIWGLQSNDLRPDTSHSPSRMLNSPRGKFKKKKMWSLSVFQISENPGPDCEGFMQSGNGEGSRRIRKAGSKRRGRARQHQRGLAAGTGPCFSYKPRTQKPRRLPAEAGPQGAPSPGCSQERGLERVGAPHSAARTVPSHLQPAHKPHTRQPIPLSAGGGPQQTGTRALTVYGGPGGVPRASPSPSHTPQHNEGRETEPAEPGGDRSPEVIGARSLEQKL